MPPQESTVIQDATCTGGLCLVALAPVSNSIVVEQPAEARDYDTGSCDPINERRSPGAPGVCGTSSWSPSLAGRLPGAACTEQGCRCADRRNTASNRHQEL